MNPQLTVITGPLKGMILELSGSVSIGRDKENTLRIKQLSVSRRHCVVEREDNRFKVVDKSSYGTFVNHIPVKERYLEHGDEIRVGESLLIFLLHEDQSDLDLNTTKLNQTGVITLSAIHLRQDDVFNLKPEARQEQPRLTREVSTLLKISALIGNERDRGTLHGHLLDSILDYIPATRGAILRVEKTSGKYSVRSSRSRAETVSKPIHVSWSSLEQVVRDGIAILSHEVLETPERRSGAKSDGSRSYSLLCAPLGERSEEAEVIYLLSDDGGAAFEEKHLELLTAITVIASIALRNIDHMESLESENSRLRHEAVINHNMIGEGAAMREIYQLIAKVAPSDSTVLILGESGTGKELAAYAIHANSPRADKPFIAINCAALAETLLDSELFGHEKGAFTGAYAQKKGKLELANGGTFFLDEVGETSPALQAKLLRVLQKSVFERVGGQHQIKVDVRLLAATNKDLADAVRHGSFRKDLYYRLSVVEMMMPPLRERREDIPLLANYFVARNGQKCKRRVLGISPEARACLVAHDWPGNVRELENVIERAVVLGSAELIQPEDLPHNLSEKSRSGQPQTLSFKAAVIQKKEEIIRAALEQAKGSIAEAAKLLGMHPPNLHRLIRTLGLKVKIKE